MKTKKSAIVNKMKKELIKIRTELKVDTISEDWKQAQKALKKFKKFVNKQPHRG